MSWWEWYLQNREGVAPLLAFLGSLIVGLGTVTVGALVARAALRQARIASQQAQIATHVAEAASRQADIAGQRHEAQTTADRQRRITESYSKAVEQLGGDKIEARLGGIYMLERISRESLEDYWTVMETLCAFARGRARWKAPEDSASETMARFYEGNGLDNTDIATVLTVIRRRPADEREREKKNRWRLDLRGMDLREAVLEGAHLEGCSLSGAHLEWAILANADLGGAELVGAHFTGTDLRGADLRKADLGRARLKRAVLTGANFTGAKFIAARLEGVDFSDACLKDVDLSGASGDQQTRLPNGVPRPSHWPAAER